MPVMRRVKFPRWQLGGNPIPAALQVVIVVLRIGRRHNPNTLIMTDKFKQYIDYLDSLHWSNLRDLKFLEVGRRCQHCGDSRKIEVHHVHYRNYTDCTTADLIVFCQKCHSDLHLALKIKRLQVDDADMDIAKSLIVEYRASPAAAQRAKFRAATTSERALKKQERKERKAGLRHDPNKLSKREYREIKRAFVALQNTGLQIDKARILLNVLMRILKPHPAQPEARERQ